MFSCSTFAFKARKLWDNAQILDFCFSKNFLGTFKEPIRKVSDSSGLHGGLHGFFPAGDQKAQVKFEFLFY